MDAEPQALAVTYRFDVPPGQDSAAVAVRFRGTRSGAVVRGPADRFERIERIDEIPARGGPVAITARISDITPGEWRVVAEPVARSASLAGLALPRQVSVARTRLVVLAHGPAVHPVWWPVLVGLGAVVAIALQATLVSRAHFDVLGTFLLAVLACTIGFATAKAWYLVQHRRHPRTILTAGACIQGFLVGAFGTLAIGATMAGLPVGTLLDATAPGLFLGMAVGRPGCFLSGCCAGRPTSSRWGLWSSDRRLAIRRHPVQLAEAALALVIGLASLAVDLTVTPAVGGAAFAGAVAAYTFGRQLLFPLRSDPHTRAGRIATMGMCGLVLIAVTAILVQA
ncbi:prolipoprotein diacylglyceryl transferase family protein [Amycolatopsis sp. NPDC003865]